MEEPDAFRQQLTATFQQEALEHLLRLEGRLVGLEQAGQGSVASVAAAEEAARMLADLHTLKGAARAASKPALAQLCHAFENVVSARGFGAGMGGARFDVLHDSLKVARKLVQEGNGRVLNQARSSIGRLDSLAQTLAGDGQPAIAPAPSVASEDAASVATKFPPDASPSSPPTAGAAASKPLPSLHARAVSNASISSNRPASADHVASANPARSPPSSAAPAAPATRRDAESAIRVPTRHLDLIRQHAEEMLLVELDLQHAAAQLDDVDSPSGEHLLQHCRRAARDLERLRQRFSLLRNGLLDSALESSMEPFSRVFDQFPGMVRDLARAAGKQVVLHLEGESACVDRRIMEPVRDILIQLLTNAVDHGIEAPALREKAGKPPAGQLWVSVRASGADSVEISVDDDGAGIDLEAVRRAAGQQLAAEELAAMSPAQVAQLVFRPGLSTAPALTDSSGRGVGLALVADKLAAVGGQAELDSRPGRGCSFRLKLPVRMARMLGLVVRIRKQRFVLPLAPLKAVFLLTEEQIQMVRNPGSLRWNETVIPAIPAAHALGLAETDQLQRDHHAVVVEGVNGPFALLVDDILEEQEVLPKTLGKQLRRVRCLAGATQLADGALAPILALDDFARLQQSGPASAPAAPPAKAGPPRLLVAEDSPTTRLLMKHILESAGYAVDTAVDGLEAWGRLRRGGYAGLVSDVSMPNLDGFSLCERVRADAQTARLPVVLVTSLQSASEKERGLHAGADAYLSKGAFDQDALLATLRRLIATEGA